MNSGTHRELRGKLLFACGKQAAVTMPVSVDGYVIRLFRNTAPFFTIRASLPISVTRCLPHFQHPVQRPLRGDPYLFRHLDDVFHLFHGPKHTLQSRPFHIRADHLAREEMERFLRVVLPEPVEDAFLGPDDELLVR